MISTTRNWLRRNRTNLGITVGVLGAGYVACQYFLSKIAETGERMSNGRTAKENLRRRFQQNQEDCTITVLALLPTATENITGALPVESITQELQQKKAERLKNTTESSETIISELSSGSPSVAEEDGRSLASLQSGSFVHASQMGASAFGSSSKSKVQLWNELKINSITRCFTLLYTLCLLTLLTRIQLNLLGRRNYLSSIVSASYPPEDKTIRLENRDDDNVEQPFGNDFETNRKFLTFSWWLLHRGWRDLMEEVQSAIGHVFGPVKSTEEIQFEQLSSLIINVRRRVEGETPEQRKSKKWLAYLLPPLDQESSILREASMDTNSSSPSPPTATTSIPSPPSSPLPSSSAIIPPPLRSLLDETSDFIDSPPFSQILTQLLDATFSHLTDQNIRSQAFKPALSLIQEVPSAEPSTANLLGPDGIGGSIDLHNNNLDEPVQETSPKTKLAIILAVMVRQAHVIGSGVPNEYVQALDEVRDLEAFAAVVYSSRFELDAVGENIDSRTNVTAGTGEVTDEEISDRDRRRGDKTKSIEKSEEGTGLIDKASSAFENVWDRALGSVKGKG